MDVRAAVYNASRNGKLNKLRSLLTGKSRNETLDIVQSVHNGTTPMIMSCKNGHTHIVKYIVDTCGADPELTASVIFDGETIEGAPPLWCAAAAGHMSIVKFLVERGCNVNKTTLSSSTPLRAACFDGHFDIVSYLVKNKADIEIANRHGHTCLMISCYKGHKNIVKMLLDQNVDVDRKSNKGNTALHDCAESGSLEIMIMLLQASAKMAKDAHGLTPIMAAALSGYSHIVVYLCSKGHCSRTEKINAMELLGSTFIDKKRDMITAVQYWQSAIDLRSEDVPIPKKDLVKSIAAYDNVIEATEKDELTELLSDPDELRMQALLVRERILGHSHPDTSYYIRYRGALYADMGNFERCLKLWMYALEMQQSVLHPLNPMTQSSFLSFAELFSFITDERKNSQMCNFKFDDIFAVFTKAIAELDRARGLSTENCDDFITEACMETHRNRLIIIIMHLLSLICRVYPIMEPVDDDRFRKAVYRWLKMGYRAEGGATPLHLACSKKTTSVGKYPVCIFPSYDVVRLLIDVGADVNALDSQANTPLHVAASDLPCQFTIILLLLQEGAHIDYVNDDNKTSAQLIDITLQEKETTFNHLSYVTLQCLASRVIKKHNLKYVGHVPRKLERFIELH